MCTLCCQQTYLKLFPGHVGQRRPMLLFLFRDADQIPHQSLCNTIEGALRNIWMRIAKPPEYANATVNDYLEVPSPCKQGSS